MNRCILKNVMNRRIKSVKDTDVTIDIINKYFNENLGFGKYKQTAIDLLQITINILNEFEIPYCLISGTLLGYVRHNDFIPWDDDIDLLVDSSIINKYENIIKKYNDTIKIININNIIIKICFKNKEYPIQNHKSNHIDTYKTYNWPFIDLFPFTYENINTLNFFGKLWKVDEFFPLNNVLFLGMNVAIPKNPDYFLELNFSKNYLVECVSNKYIHKKEKLTKDNIVKISYEKLLEYI